MILKIFFHRVLPIALPFLVLLAVLTSCGKGNKITTDLKNSDKPGVKTQAQTVPLPKGDDLPAFASRCTNTLRGKVDTSTGAPVCVSPVTVQNANLALALTGEQVITGAAHAGDLVISSGDATDVDVTLNGQRLMKVGARNVLAADGRLAYFAATESQKNASVAIYTCANASLDRVACTVGMMQ